MAPQFWIVICPEPYVQEGLWRKWFDERCVAVGWGPPDWTLEGGSDSPAWTYARARLKEMNPGDKVIPFLLKWRIGPVGTIRALHIGDDEWNATVPQGSYTPNPDVPELGRRIELEWDTQGMPPPEKVALVPSDQRFRTPLARRTIEKLSEDEFAGLVHVLENPRNWVDLSILKESVDTLVQSVSQDQSISILERDLQKFLTRNLNIIESGLIASPEHQLEEFLTDVGRLDLFCLDKNGNYVVVELKAGWAGDDAIGQITGYMAWIKDNIAHGKTVRGIIVCHDAGERVKSACGIIPNLKVKKFNMIFTVEDLTN